MNKKEKTILEIEKLCDDFMNDLGQMISKLREKNVVEAAKIIAKKTSEKKATIKNKK